MNLHGIVRGAITTVNPDTLCTWQQATGYTQDDDGKQEPTYNTVSNVPVQVQGLSNPDLRHAEFLNLEGVLRKVYLFGSINGVVRPNFAGGDLLSFPKAIGASAQLWKVVSVAEDWPDQVAAGWSSAIVCLQEDVTA